MDLEQFESIKRYVGFTERSASLLKEFEPVARHSFNAIVDDFYNTIEQNPDARAAISGGEAQVNRLKRTLIEWLGSVLTGPHNEDYIKAHSRIGRVHVRIALPQHFMFTAMNRIRSGLIVIATRSQEDLNSRGELISAINQVLDIELAIMLETYRQDLMTKVRASERLATIGQLAASIGHELRNPLGVVESSLFLLGQRLRKLELQDAVLNKHHQRIAEQVQACAGTISSLLDLARDSPTKKQIVHIEQLLSSSLDALSIPDGIRLERRIPSDQTVWADPQQLQRVLANLLANALQALGQKGTIVVSAAQTESGTEILVDDDGPGISDDLGERIFDVLVTTRAKGTGLGLALCRKIVEAHQGSLELVPSSSGATFRVWLPKEES